MKLRGGRSKEKIDLTNGSILQFFGNRLKNIFSNLNPRTAAFEISTAGKKIYPALNVKNDKRLVYF
jgi:hypothetical protein